jgi:hypothetical protein
MLRWLTGPESISASRDLQAETSWEQQGEQGTRELYQTWQHPHAEGPSASGLSFLRLGFLLAYSVSVGS